VKEEKKKDQTGRNSWLYFVGFMASLCKLMRSFHFWQMAFEYVLPSLLLKRNTGA